MITTRPPPRTRIETGCKVTNEPRVVITIAPAGEHNEPEQDAPVRRTWPRWSAVIALAGLALPWLAVLFLRRSLHSTALCGCRVRRA